MPLRLPYACRLFLFDLDGTLIDSRSDITNSLNLALARLGQPSITTSKVADFVGDGVRKLILRALEETSGSTPEASQVDRCIKFYLDEYEHHMLDSTHLYPGVAETLDRLSWADFAVVTNKPAIFSRRILHALGLEDRFCVILGGDSGARRKPDPAPLLETAKRCNAPAGQTVMVGDSAVDVQAGKAAGIATCGIAGGFRGRAELEAAGADLILQSFSQLPAYFCTPD